jgi:hypothetical protein
VAEEEGAIHRKERVSIEVVLVMLITGMMMVLKMMVTVTVIVLRSEAAMGASTVTKEEGRTFLIFRQLVQT